MSKKRFDDDDGRTIADMSDLSVRTPLGYYHPGKHRSENAKRQNSENAPQRGAGDRPWEDNSMSREGRRGAIFGALSASLLIALVFIVGFGVFIALFCVFFRK